MSKILNPVKDVVSTIVFVVGIVTIISSIHGILLLNNVNHVFALFEILKDIAIGIITMSMSSFLKHRVAIR